MMIRRGFSYKNNSCFFNSVLISMFGYHTSPFIIDEINPKYCKLINLLNRLMETDEYVYTNDLQQLITTFDDGNQHDVGEAYGYIIQEIIKPNDDSIFKIYGDLFVLTYTIEEFNIIINDNYVLGVPLDIHTKIQTINTNFLVIFIARHLYTNEKEHSDIERIPKSMIIDNRKLFLFSMILHDGGVNGGHYTCILRDANDNTYMYNDMANSGKITKIDIESVEDIKKKCVMLFYYPL